MQARQEVGEAVSPLRIGSVDRGGATAQSLADHLPSVAEQALQDHGPPLLAREALAVRTGDVAPRVRVAEADERLQRCSRIAFRSRSRTSSMRVSRSSTSSCSAWRERPTSASYFPVASLRTSSGASSGGVHGASAPNDDVISVRTSPGLKTNTGMSP